MDYLSLKFLNRGGPVLDRTSDERLRKPPPPPSAAQSSPTSIKTSNSTNSRHPSPRPSSLVLANNDPLPTTFAALEGHLNHHASQLQQLADRAESINEWIELDNIVLARLVRDEEKRVEEAIFISERNGVAKGDIAAADDNDDGEEGGKKKGGVHFALVTPDAVGLVVGGEKEVKMAKRSASMGDVPRLAALPPKSEGQRKEEAVAEHAGIKEVRERIRGMKRWRKEVERAVVVSCLLLSIPELCDC
ncbi:MAG: hypothetical protein L6R39_005070 [Caloplaca ligustica]|nr:MAG: hypothetical protein L6R39_005070 [Caloplaca ligustica]